MQQAVTLQQQHFASTQQQKKHTDEPRSPTRMLSTHLCVSNSDNTNKQQRSNQNVCALQCRNAALSQHNTSRRESGVVWHGKERSGGRSSVVGHRCVVVGASLSVRRCRCVVAVALWPSRPAACGHRARSPPQSLACPLYAVFSAARRS